MQSIQDEKGGRGEEEREKMVLSNQNSQKGGEALEVTARKRRLQDYNLIQLLFATTFDSFQFIRVHLEFLLLLLLSFLCFLSLTFYFPSLLSMILKCVPVFNVYNR